MSVPHEALICDSVRTPFGRYGGALAAVRPDDLAAIPLRAIVQRHPEVDWETVDDVILGCANQAGEDNRNVARMALLLAGIPYAVSGTTVNRLCGSGMDAIAIAARAIQSGQAGLLLAGGVESMSRAPFVLGKSNTPFSREAKLEDTTLGWRFINPSFKERYGVDSMPETGENVAKQYGISRAAQDEFALRSQQRAALAQQRGYTEQEIILVSIPRKKGEPLLVEVDEHPRPDTTLAGLAALKPVVKAGGTVTAGNASGLNDGAAALLITSSAVAARFGLKPIVRVVATATAGVLPRVMGIGPVPAVLKVLAQTGLRLDQMDVIELNEAFAAQALAALRELGLDDSAEHVNPNGGAIAIGHPLGASGARLVMNAARHLQRTGGRFGLCTMCVGVGQGIAMVLERI